MWIVIMALPSICVIDQLRVHNSLHIYPNNTFANRLHNLSFEKMWMTKTNLSRLNEHGQTIKPITDDDDHVRIKQAIKRKRHSSPQIFKHVNKFQRHICIGRFKFICCATHLNRLLDVAPLQRANYTLHDPVQPADNDNRP